LNGQIRRSKILCRGQHILAQQRAHQRIQTQSLHTLDFMQVRVRGLGSLARRARNRPSKGHPAPAEMVMARWPMAALLSSAALIARRRRDVRGV